MSAVNIDKTLSSVCHNSELFKQEYLDFIYSKSHEVESLIAYGGGKYKMRKELNDIFNNYLTRYNFYDTYIDGFYGMGGSFKALSDSLEKHGVKNIIVNEINPCISKMHMNIRNAPNKMKDYFLDVIRTKVVMPYGKLNIPYDEMIKAKKVLIDRFKYLQDREEFGVETSTLLIMLSAFNYSGMLQFRKGGKLGFGLPIYQYSDIDDFFLKTIKRIDTFSKLYNRFDMKFYNYDYLTLHKHFKDKPHTLWNIDPVYFKEDYREYNKEEMENIKNEDIRECTVNYAQPQFKHLECLDTIKDIDFIYNNNTSPLLYHYIYELNLEYKIFDRSDNINGKAKKKAKIIKELILHKNNYKNPANNLLQKPTQKCA